MSEVTIPDEIIDLLRAHDDDWETDPGELIVRALLGCMSLRKRRQLTPEERDRLVRHAEELRAAMERAGITEQEILDDFEKWRHRQRPDDHP